MSDLQEHINNCDCRLVQCPNGCGGKFLQRGLEKHVLTKCPKRPQPTSPPPSAPLPQKPKEEPKTQKEAKASPKRKSESDLKALLSARNIGAKEEPSDRTSRRNFALSQLTAPQEQLPDEDEDDEDEDDEDDDDMSLAQVVAEWNVENVCLWLREDVGVPDVVDRFEALQIDGQMLLELDERALVNDLGIKAKLSRDRILAAIGAIKTSDGSDGDDDDDDDETDQPLRI
ncbi:unnamed protein product [Aphanomyces euteiches]